MENRELEIQQCRAELAELTRRVDALQLRIDALEGKPAAAVLSKPMETPAVRTEEKTMAKTEKKSKRHNLESAVGRNLFAVLASVLVLIGVGVFISTIYEQIPEIVKIAAIYLFGFALLGVGLALYRKNQNKFWLGVASCGLAELLVSIITSHSYFGVLPLLPTFALVLVWITASFYLTKFHPTVFKTIGFVGFLISIALGLELVPRSETGIYLTLLGAYAALSVFFMITNRAYVTMNTAMAFGSLAGLLLFWELHDRLPANIDDLSGIVILSILAVFHGIYLWKGKLHKDAYSLFSLGTLLVSYIYLSVYENALLIPAAGALVFLLWYLQYRYDADRDFRCGYTALAGVYLAHLCMVVLGRYQWEIWWYLAFGAVAYGLYWLTKRRDMAWLGFAAFLMFGDFILQEAWLIWAQIGVAAVMIYLCGGRFLRRDEALQVAWYVLLFLLLHDANSYIRHYFVVEMDYEARRAVYQIIDGIFFAVLTPMNTAFLHKTLKDPEKHLRINGKSLVVMALQLYVLVGCFQAVDSDLWYVTGLGIASSLMIVSYSLWYSFKTKGTGSKLMVWQCVKFTLYCWIILALLDSPNIFIHISLLLVAILAVVLGFKLGHKAVRVYGLVLSLLDVVSLVLFNIDYGNSLQLAGGIVLCGALCFVISFIYSRLSKVF